MSKLTNNSSCLLDLPLHVLETIENSSLTKEEKRLVAQITHNYYVRGLLWFDDDDNGYTRNGVTDSTIAVTELIVLTNCLRNLQKGDSVSHG